MATARGLFSVPVQAFAEITEQHTTPAGRTLGQADHGIQLVKAGQERDGLRFLLAHNIIHRENLANFAEFGWAPSLVEPRMAIRWGVAIDLARPYEGDAKPIGSGPQAAASRRERSAENPSGGLLIYDLRRETTR